MLSILIPVYHFDVTKLVSDLLGQIDLINHKIEIILLDDGSESTWQDQYLQWENHTVIRLYHNNSNQGRVAARRKLADRARFDNLLFIDCDAEMMREDYLNDYINQLSGNQVICGGHEYQKSRPSDRYLLHWRYGTQVEVRSLAQRSDSPFASFSTFNFCCKKSIYQEYLSEIEVDGYGHEDTLIGHVLLKRAIPIIHIENPLIHIGLKDAKQFISDAVSAIDNAFLLKERYPDLEIKLLNNVKRIKQSGLGGLIKWILSLGNKKRISNLNSNNPSINKLQLFKVYYALSKD